MHKIRLKNTTKEAIKVGIAVASTILVSLWLGWDKSYWSAITVFVVAANETYSHSIHKARNRLLGTVIGVVASIFLLSQFPQDKVLFTLFYTLFMAFSAFMSVHKRYGYAFRTGFVVCVVIASVSGFNADTSFAYSILRIQETVLGIVVYSVVFRFIWPKKTEDVFFEIMALSTQHNRKKLRLITHNQLQSATPEVIKDLEEESIAQISRLNKLDDILGLALTDSSRLAYERVYWRLIVKALMQFEALMTQKIQGEKIDSNIIVKGAKILSKSLCSPKSNNGELMRWCDEIEANYRIKKAPVSAFSAPVKQRIIFTCKAVSILLTSLAFWIYLPVPGSSMMPMVASVFAIVLAPMPSKAIKFTAICTAIWGVFFLAEFVFIIPAFTEAWQLALLYLFNGIFIWKVSEAPSLQIQKSLAGNLSVVLCMGALQSSPNFEITTPLMMLTVVFIILGIINFYNKLYRSV
ncbi:fusaric acid resistance protein [Psychromonas marina]|uniref:Fusaric acid resistance protein n=1 Tax=Psychromonas marina TaxID=88364 RepID=A0ABQ6E0B8_9GAMM|nr:FUSC family protein [Psychromonas marina]GLS90790.1 fusaric acid resistance protein [Psychromonas marina]